MILLHADLSYNCVSFVAVILQCRIWHTTHLKMFPRGSKDKMSQIKNAGQNTVLEYLPIQVNNI